MITEWHIHLIMQCGICHYWPYGARPSAGTVMTTKLYMLLSLFYCYQRFCALLMDQLTSFKMTDEMSCNLVALRDLIDNNFRYRMVAPCIQASWKYHNSLVTFIRSLPHTITRRFGQTYFWNVLEHLHFPSCKSSTKVHTGMLEGMSKIHT